MTRIFCLINNITHTKKDNYEYFNIELKYNGLLGKSLFTSLLKHLKSGKRKLIEITNYPSDKWEAAFKLWHKIIDLIVAECAEKKIDIIFNTTEKMNKENLKDELKWIFGYFGKYFEREGVKCATLKSSRDFTFDELLNIINNTIQYANDNDVSVQEYLDEYQRLMRGDIDDKNS